MDVIEPTSRQEERNILQLSTETEINMEIELKMYST